MRLEKNVFDDFDLTAILGDPPPKADPESGVPVPIAKWIAAHKALRQLLATASECGGTAVEFGKIFARLSPGERVRALDGVATSNDKELQATVEQFVSGVHAGAGVYWRFDLDELLYSHPAVLAKAARIGGLPPTEVLHAAARHGYCEIVEQVLRSGAIRAASISKALRLAASHGRLSVVELLVQKGASMTPSILRAAAPHVLAWAGSRMMASAIRSHDFAAVVEMLASGVRPDTNQGAAALRWAAHYGLAQVVGALLRAGVDPGSERSLALRWALGAGHDAIAATLVAAGARLGDVDRSSVPESRLALLGM